MKSIEEKVLAKARAIYNISDREELRRRLIEEWGEHAPHGYGIFVWLYHTDAEYIAKIDALDVFETDLDAAKQAKKDGIRLIPYREQPKSNELRHYRFIDTQKNRRLLFGKQH